MGTLLVIDRIGGEAWRDVQQCAWGRGYLRAADGSSFCTLTDGVIGQMIRCTNNGRYFYISSHSRYRKFSGICDYEAHWVAPQLNACHYPKFSLGHGNI